MSSSIYRSVGISYSNMDLNRLSSIFTRNYSNTREPHGGNQEGTRLRELEGTLGSETL